MTRRLLPKKATNSPFVKIMQGDVLDQLRTLPDESVHCCVTSPPYWGLRDYSRCGCSIRSHKPGEFETDGDQGNGVFSKVSDRFCPICHGTGVVPGTEKQLGLESTPEGYLMDMVDVFREIKRVLRSDGTCWINMGDTFRDKQLVGQPWRLALALQDDGWYLRSDIIWSKPNPMPESVTDRPTKSHEYIFLLSKSPRYFYDQEAVREPQKECSIERAKYSYAGFQKFENADHSSVNYINPRTEEAVRQRQLDGVGRNSRTVWEIATQPYPEAHFATFPEEIPRRCIKAGTSEKGCCPKCGAPWERIEQLSRTFESGSGKAGHIPNGKNGTFLQGGGETKDIRRGPCVSSKTLGWKPSCQCDILETASCTVLDPFGGSGTTGAVARSLGRSSILIELNPEYVKLIQERTNSKVQALTAFGVVANDCPDVIIEYEGRCLN